jgi:TRAP-type C4-dicarboxylate transport system substrate-binding protein
VLKSKLTEVAKYWTKIPVVSGVQLGVVASTDAWGKLDPEAQQALTQAAAGTSAAILDWADTSGRAKWAELEAIPGVSVYTIPAAELGTWMDSMRDSQRGLLEEVLSVDEATSLLDLIAQAR